MTNQRMNQTTPVPQIGEVTKAIPAASLIADPLIGS
jgi:hypothetical protein